MAENMPSNTVPKTIFVRNEFLSERMAKPDTGTVSPTFRQAAEGASHHISGRCEGNKDNDDENLSDTAAENSQTIDIGPGDFDTYAIAYICKEQTIRMKKAVKETKNKPFQPTKTAPDNTNNDNDTETSTFNANDSNIHTQARDPNPIIMEPIASLGPARDPNPMYTHTNTSPTHSRNDVNPNPMYLQSSPEPTFKSNKRDDNPCTQTSADIHQQVFSRPATNNDDNHYLQPYAVARYQDGDEAASMKIPGDNEDHPCIQPEDQEPSLNCDGGQPYAARYQEDDDSGSAASKNRHTASIASKDEVIQPYAAAYMCQGDAGWNTTSRDTQASLSSQNQNQPTAASNNINDVSTSPSSNDVLHALDPNPMYAAADMCQGDVGWNTTSGDTQASLSSQNLPAAASNSINAANDVLHALNPNPMYVPNVQHPAAHGCTRRRVIFAVGAAFVLGLCIVAGVFLWLFLSARLSQLPAVSNTPHHKGCDVKQEKITFGGKGKEPGKFPGNVRVAVSADNEIFVTVCNWNYQRVQVFSINATYLRRFSTVVPGESKTMRPYGVASDVESGYLWGVFPVIAMDVRNNKVIVGDLNIIMVFDPNGSRIWSSKLPTEEAIMGVTSDKEGNVLLTDWNKGVYKYNTYGVKIFEFGTCGKGQSISPRGICVDTSGRIIVANEYNDRVDIFTSQGEFVRSIAGIKFPQAVAMGPCGELVVTSRYNVIIFPRHMVLP
ncbi:hypothetical protein Bbelb_267960 [Branchiostoma belcheri]|nr:hypothetical protein Bbelb_267960 [Branchiostoma belcheri]